MIKFQKVQEHTSPVIKSKTVFVVGAGASCEVGLPVGIKLAEQIAQKLTITEDSGFGRPIFGDRDVGAALRKLGQDEFSKCVQAARIISAGVTYAHSIDDFIDSYPSMPQVSLVGKVAIAQAIIEAERGSKLFVNPDNIYNVISAQSISDSWYPYLIRILSSGVNVNDVDKIFENVSFVSFNYDRCIEQFLTYALAARFNMPLERAAKLCELNPVMHPYGCLNTLGLPTQGTGLRYGAETNVDLKAASENLKTYTEQIHPQQHELQKIRSAIADAHTIIFIGFAFHEQNMKLLRPPQGISAARIYATTFEMSDSDREIVRSFLSDFWDELHGKDMQEQHELVLSPQKCSDFFSDYQRTIAN